MIMMMTMMTMMTIIKHNDNKHNNDDNITEAPAGRPGRRCSGYFALVICDSANH